MLKYIPYFNRIVDTILGTGEPGQKFIEICSKYMENLTFAKEKGKKTAITTFCFSPSIFYAMDIVPICLEVLSVMMTFVYKRGTAEFMDYCNEVGFTETSCSSQRGTSRRVSGRYRRGYRHVRHGYARRLRHQR